MPTPGKAMLAGWLYADLLVVLLIAALGGVAVAGSSQPATGPSASAATQEAEAHESTLVRKPIKLVIAVDAGGLRAGESSEASRFRRKFSSAIRKAAEKRNIDPGELRIGVSLTFGYDRDLATAMDTATAANREAARAEPDMWRGAVVKDYGNTRIDMPSNRVSFEIYVSR